MARSFGGFLPPLAYQDWRRWTLGACDNSWENRREVPARTKRFFCRLEFRHDSAALTFQLHRLLWLVIFHTHQSRTISSVRTPEKAFISRVSRSVESVAA